MDLAGRRILVVEDDYLLATEICRDLRDLGATVLGPAPTPFYALSLLGRRGVDGAVLDIRLHGTNVFEVADELAQRGTPMVFATSYGPEMLPDRHRHRPLITKPYDRKALLRVVHDLTGQPQPAPPATPAEIIHTPGGEGRHDRLMRAVAKSILQPLAV